MLVTVLIAGVLVVVCSYIAWRWIKVEEAVISLLTTLIATTLALAMYFSGQRGFQFHRVEHTPCSGWAPVCISHAQKTCLH